MEELKELFKLVDTIKSKIKAEEIQYQSRPERWLEERVRILLWDSGSRCNFIGHKWSYMAFKWGIGRQCKHCGGHSKFSWVKFKWITTYIRKANFFYSSKLDDNTFMEWAYGKNWRSILKISRK